MCSGVCFRIHQLHYQRVSTPWTRMLKNKILLFFKMKISTNFTRTFLQFDNFFSLFLCEFVFPFCFVVVIKEYLDSDFLLQEQAISVRQKNEKRLMVTTWSTPCKLWVLITILNLYEFIWTNFEKYDIFFQSSISLSSWNIFNQKWTLYWFLCCDLVSNLQKRK